MSDTTPGAPETEALTETRSLNLVIQDALVHRLKWASVHWGTEAVASEAWPHLADAVADHVIREKAHWLCVESDPARDAAQRAEAWEEGVAAVLEVAPIRNEGWFKPTNPYRGARC